MANPQIENGYTKIANEIIEKLCSYRISGEENLILWVIFRKTYGFNKKDDHIALDQFKKLTKLKKPTIQRAITKLENKKIIIVKRDSDIGNTYKFNKNFDEWAQLSKKITTKSVINKDNQGDSIKITRGESLLRHTKETYKRNIKEIAGPSPADDKNNMAYKKEGVELIKAFETINPACKRMYGNKTQRQACDDLIENYGFDRVKIVIEKTLVKTNTIEYIPTITTPLQLFQKWSSLEAGIKKLKSRIEKNKVAF